MSGERWVVHPADGLQGAVRVPGDKSITHRAVMLASISEGCTAIEHAGTGADNLSTVSAMRALGVEITHDAPEHMTVQGVGLRGLRAPDAPIDCGNSGTTARLLSGLLAGAGVTAELVGDESLSSRPMRRVADPLVELGYDVSTSPTGRLPLRVAGTPRSGDDVPVRAVLRTASAQVKSCILLSGLYRDTITEVVEPAASRDHTERMFRALGVRCVSSAHYRDGAPEHVEAVAPWVRLHPTTSIRARDLRVPGDPSSAAFLAVAAALVGGEVTVREVGTNPTRAAFLSVMTRMGAAVSLRGRRVLSTGEPAADVAVSAAALKGTTIEGAEVPLVIDEIPVLCVLGAAASGRFEVRDAAELRVKESDRIALTAALLRSLGVEVEEREDGLSFDGLGRAGWPGFQADGAHDHRIALSAAVAALAATGPSEITGAECIGVSFPTFAETLAELGAKTEVLR